MGHTPGPWTLFDRLVQGRGGAPVAAVHGPHAYANARLIAAAPELLEALKAALSYADMEMHHETVDEYWALIAKAEGRSE